jgi:OOP family OmpA-OmpF porin
MKKLVLSALLAATIVSANDYNYEITPTVGIAFPNSAQEIKSHGVYGAEMLYNGYDAPIKPEVTLLMSNADYKNSIGNTNIFRLAVNGVYAFTMNTSVTPFVKLGLGAEVMNNTQYDNHNGPFVDAGVGIKIALYDQIALKLEAIEMLKFNHLTTDDNLMLMVGLDFAFGDTAKASAPLFASEDTASQSVSK